MSPSVDEKGAAERGHDQRAEKARDRWMRRGEELRDAFTAATREAGDASRRVAGARQAREGLEQALTALPARAHATVDQLVESAPEQFHAAVAQSTWIGYLARGISAPLPAELLTWHALCEDGKPIAARLHESVDRLAADPAASVLANGDADQLEAEIQAARKAQREAEAARDAAEQKVTTSGRELRTWEMGQEPRS